MKKAKKGIRHKIRPIGGQLLAILLDKETMSQGGIALPATHEGKTRKARVIATGPGLWEPLSGKYKPMEVAVGEIILTTSWGGKKIELDGEEYVVLTEMEIGGVLEGEQGK